MMHEALSVRHLWGTGRRFRLIAWPYDVAVNGERFHVTIVQYRPPGRPGPVSYRTQLSRGPNDPVIVPIQEFETRDEAIAGARRQIEEHLGRSALP